MDRLVPEGAGPFLIPEEKNGVGGSSLGVPALSGAADLGVGDLGDGPRG
jgi:hypothetical protein